MTNESEERRGPALTVDGVIAIDEKIVLIRRGWPPFQGMFALPGGFVEYGESTESAVMREVEEECGVKTSIVRLVGVYSEPGRDPRGHVASVVYQLRIIEGELNAGDDASAVELVDIRNLPELAFDHSKIVADFLKKIKQIDSRK